MNIDEKIQTARSIVAEAESRDATALAIVRGLLGEIEEDLRTMRATVARHEIQYFTRKVFCEKLGDISIATLRRMEGDGKIAPAIDYENTKRYSSLQLEHAGEILRGLRTHDGRMKRPEVSGQASAVRRRPSLKVIANNSKFQIQEKTN
jgi:hypothetical protein